MGLIGCLLATLVAEGELVLMSPEQFIARPLSWLKALHHYKGTTSAVPNFALAYVCQRTRPEQLQELDLSHWSIAMVGAEPVLPDNLEIFAEHLRVTGFKKNALTPVYGLAEATLAVTFSPFESPYKLLSVDREALSESGRLRAWGLVPWFSLGRPIKGVDIQVRDGPGQVLGEGRLGQVFVRSGATMAGYLDRPERTAQVLEDGWLNTGDLGFLFEGDLYLYGRAKDLLIIGGRNHEPGLVEAAVSDLPDVRRCAAFSNSDPSCGTETLTVVVERRRRSISPNELAELTRTAVVEASGLAVHQVWVVEAGQFAADFQWKNQKTKSQKGPGKR